jgi:CheY-like chemotaxis protein
MARILVVEDSRTQAREIQFLLEDAGYEVALAGNGVEGLAALQKGLPDVVLTDLDMPQMNGLELVEAVRRDYPTVPVILMTALGSEEIAVQALQKGAASYIPKRNLTNDIVNTLENVLAVAQASGDRQRVLGCLTQSEHRFVLDNDATLVPPLIVHLEENVSRMQATDRTDLMRVGIALHEALLNAIQHGNLELSSDLRQEDERVYRDLGEQRRRQSPYKDRHVRVTVALTRGEAVYVIEDEGPGFDPSTLPDPTDHRITLRKRSGKRR